MVVHIINFWNLLKKRGVVDKISAIRVGELSMMLGAGRKTKEDSIYYDVGVKLYVQVGDKVKKGDILAKVYYKHAPHLQDFKDIFVIK